MPMIISSDAKMVREGAHDFFREKSPILSLRKLRDSQDPDGFSRPLWREMAELGWTGFLVPEDHGGSGFGHVGLCTTDPLRDQAFWLQHFNAMVSDWIGPCPLMRVNPRHHQMALFPSTRKGIQHINYQVQDFDDVMRSYYFLKDKGIKIVFGPGRHATSGGIFVYFEGPDGMVYEYSNSDRKIIEDSASYRPRQFPMHPSSFCVWGAKPDIAEFKE